MNSGSSFKQYGNDQRADKRGEDADRAYSELVEDQQPE
jgi:hypothetical protein